MRASQPQRTHPAPHNQRLWPLTTQRGHLSPPPSWASIAHPSWPRSTASHRAPGRLDTTLLRDSRVELGEADALPAELGGPALVVVQYTYRIK